MGRGTILADLGEGQYTIKLDFGESRLAAQILLLTNANSDLDTQIAAQQAKVNAAQAALNASNAALAAAINAYVAGNSSPNLLPPVETAKLDQVAKEEALRKETVSLGKLQGSKANNLRKIDDLNSYRVNTTLNAWCADYTEGASGEVATLEIPNEPKTVLIAPAGRSPVDADGELRMRALMTAPQAYYNAAILPGWQKFKPTYRSGTITAINGDAADVALDEAKSSAGGIADIGLANIEFDVNQTSTLTNVPIVYQDCNGTAFEVGDAVVVQFMSQSWSTPWIIGFLSNPRACIKISIIFQMETVGSPFTSRKLLKYNNYNPENLITNNWEVINNFQVGSNLCPYTNLDQITNETNKIYLAWRRGLNTFFFDQYQFSDIWFWYHNSFQILTKNKLKTILYPNYDDGNVRFVRAVGAKQFEGTWYVFSVVSAYNSNLVEIYKYNLTLEENVLAFSYNSTLSIGRSCEINKNCNRILLGLDSKSRYDELLINDLTVTIGILNGNLDFSFNENPNAPGQFSFGFNNLDQLNFYKANGTISDTITPADPGYVNRIITTTKTWNYGSLSSYALSYGSDPQLNPNTTLVLDYTTWTGFESIVPLIASFKSNIFIDYISRFDNVYESPILTRTRYVNINYNGNPVISDTRQSTTTSEIAFPWACAIELPNNQFCLTYNVSYIFPDTVNPNFYNNISGLSEIFSSFGNIRPLTSGFKLNLETS